MLRRNITSLIHTLDGFYISIHDICGPDAHDAAVPDVRPEVLRGGVLDQPVEGSERTGGPRPGAAAVADAARRVRRAGPQSGRDRTAAGPARHGLLGELGDRHRRPRARRPDRKRT